MEETIVQETLIGDRIIFAIFGLMIAAFLLYGVGQAIWKDFVEWIKKNY